MKTSCTTSSQQTQTESEREGYKRRQNWIKQLSFKGQPCSFQLHESHFCWKLSTFPQIPSFSINDHPVKQVSSTKSFGVHINQNMNWECHIQNICKKIASALGAIKRIRHLIPFNILINVYDSLFQPYFSYCSAVWGNCGSGLSEKLQKLQNRAARILMCANYDSDIDKLFRVLGCRKLK